MDLRKAFSYPFEDKEWVNKVLIGLLILLVPILNFAWVGYSIEIMRRVIKGEALPLPGWDDLGKKFTDGLQLFLVRLVYVLPMILLVGVPLTIMIVPAILASGKNTQQLAAVIATAGGLASLCLIGLTILYALALSVLFPAIYVEFARHGSFSACFNFKSIFGEITRNAGTYFTAWGVYLGVTIVASMAGGIFGGFFGWIPCLGQLIATVLIFSTSIYILLVHAHLFGQYGRLGAQSLPSVDAQA
jgi:hypothetical protein